MTKSKKGAEPVKVRERHVLNEVNTFYHEGINQDNYRTCRSSGYHRTSAFGYFFLGGESEIKRIKTKQDIIDNWNVCKLNDYGCECQGLGRYCYAIYNKKRNILVLDEEMCPEPWNIIRAVNKDCNIFKVRNIRDYNIIRKPKQLAIANLDYIIAGYVRQLAPYYRLLKGYSITLNYGKIYDSNIVNIRNQIKLIVDTFPSIPRNKSLGKQYIYVNRKYNAINFEEINFPTINDIINYKVFTKEEIKFINQKRWWTKYGYGKGISFKETQDNWNTKVNDLYNGVRLWQDDVITRQHESMIAWQSRVNELESKVNAYRKAAIDKVLNLNAGEQLKKWREKDGGKYDKLKIVYKDFKVRGRTIEWFEHTEFVNCDCFDNKQLKLSEDKKEVITSGGARVTLIHAISLFNTLYKKYIVPHLVDWVKCTLNEDYIVNLIDKHIHIGYYELRRIGYKEKVTDYANKPLGYKEWFVEIGCHTLWLDDVKEFVRYYHLEDKVNFDCKEIKR